MADAEEPQFTSLQARIAALNQTQAARPYGKSSTIGKRPPPPPPPTTKASYERPQPDFRSKSINIPPVSAYDASSQYDDEPASYKALSVLPPPIVERDLPQSTRVQATAKTPVLPRRESLLPVHNSMTPRISPSLPPRRPSGHSLIKRTSNESMMSQSSTISAFSMGTSAASSTTSAESNAGRKLPPRLDLATLPQLPPTKRELAAKAQQEKEEKAAAATEAKRSLQSVKSAPAVPQVAFRTPSYGQTVAALMPAPSQSPQLPPRQNSTPILPPRLPSRGTSLGTTTEEVQPTLPGRRLPPCTIPPMPIRVGSNAEQPTNSTNDTPPPIPRSSRPTAW